MKCETCIHLYRHASGLFMSIAEGCDDPYDYFYCNKSHWSDHDLPEENEPDLFVDCKDYKERRDDTID